MTRDEAIALLQSRVGKGISENEFNELKYLIDEPKLHKVSEEGYPKEDGLYLTCIENIMPFQNGTFSNMCAVYPLQVVAWQKIEEYKI